MIEKAYQVAKEQHKDQKRKSGEPYIIHPLCVAIILADLQMDKETIAAGLLHDVVEDTGMTLEEITKEFNPDVALLVDGVTKLTQLNLNTDKVEMQAENLRKMFVSMAKDIRVIIIKLADRLHNLRTLEYQTPAKQKEKARESLEIYSPLAERLGISKIKIEMDDLSLKYLEPDIYYDLAAKVNLKKEAREARIKSIVSEVSKHIKESGIDAEISGRVKHFFSIYRKMVNQNKTIDQIYDLFAIRIIVETVRDCYAALGVIHKMYTPIPGRFKDYIAMPKPNMYQSLHTTVIGSDGVPFEIQIRTFEMHRTAEFGIAAHWKYKESGGSKEKASEQEDVKMNWLHEILEWQKDESDSKEFMNMVKSDLNLFNENVFCFTPTGDVKNLPAGSCPIDFAYAIHSAVGNKMVGAKVNDKLVPVTYQLKNGDYTREETITAGNSRHQMQMTVKLGAMNDGAITAIDLHTLSNAGAYGEHATTTIGLSGHKSLPIYNHVKASRFSWDAVYTNTNRGGAYRGYGATQGQFAVESAVNELADMLHMDPADLRLKNIVREGEIMPQYYNEKLNACALDRCLLRAMDMIGWRDKPLAVDLGDRVRALGCALTMQGSGISNVDIAGIDMRLEEDGFITIGTGATDNGMGVDTILAQIAAEELGVESSLIVVRGVDTDVSPFDAGSYASSGTYVTGLAAKNAATELREKICAKAAQMWDVDAADVVFDGQYVRLSDERAAREQNRYLTLRDFANLCVKNIAGGDALTSHASACLPVSPPPFMAGIAEVEVDKATGKVTVVDYAAAVDCGTVINEALARVQAEGGIAQGIGHALYEIVEHDDRGRLRTGNFMSYKLPTRLDIGSIRVAFEPSYEPTGPFGAKSIGEVVINTPLAAVASAVAHATGHQVRSLPITPEKALLGE